MFTEMERNGQEMEKEMTEKHRCQLVLCKIHTGNLRKGTITLPLKPIQGKL
jgi:hypothetical protein